MLFPSSGDRYDVLPVEIQEQANKQYSLFEANPDHPSLRLKAIGPYWGVRMSRGYRAVARRRDNDLRPNPLHDCRGSESL